MTALTAIQRVPPDATLTVSALAASQPASRINMVAGQHWKFRDALASLMVVSANDAAYAVAERTGGSIADFVTSETATGRQLGLKDSTFADPAGGNEHIRACSGADFGWFVCHFLRPHGCA